MQDNKRMTELVGEANNAAGASQEQFEKTLDSLQSKLAQLKNAWDTYLMAITNSEVVKSLIDLLTDLITTVNKLTGSLPGVWKGIANIGIAFGGLKIGKGLFNKVLGDASKIWHGEKVDGAAKSLSQTFENIVKKGAEGLKTGIGKIKSESLWKALGNKFKSTFRKTFTPLELGMDPGKIIPIDQLDFSKVTEEGLKNLKNDFTHQLESWNLDDNPELKKKLQGLIGQGDFKAAQETVRKELKDTDKSFESTAQRATDCGATMKKTGTNFNAVGTAAASVGVALFALTTILENTGKVSKKTTDFLRILAVGFMAIPVVLKVVDAAIKIFSANATASISSIPIIGWIAAVITLLGALTVALVKAFKADTIEEKMEKAKKATEEAQKAAEAAKQAYDDLLSGRDSYNELQDKLKNLTKGTLEWKEALAESNAEVLKLLDQFPDLIEFIGYGEYGQLTIKAEGFDKAIDAQLRQSNRATSNLAATQIQAFRVEYEQAIKNTESLVGQIWASENIFKGIIHTSADAPVYDEFLLKALQHIYDSPEAREKALQHGAVINNELFSKEEIKKYFDIIAQTETKIASITTKISTLVQSVLDPWLDEAQKNYEYKDQLELILSSNLTDTEKFQIRQDYFVNDLDAYNRNTLKYKDLFGDNKNRTQWQEDFAQFAIKGLGLSKADFSTDNGDKNLRMVYAKATGQNEKDLADNLDTKEMLKVIYEHMTAFQMGEGYKQIQGAATALSPEQQQQFFALMSGDFSQFNYKEIQDLQNANLEQMLRLMFGELFDQALEGNSEAIVAFEKMGIDIRNLPEYTKENFKEYTKAYDDLKKFIGQDYIETVEDLSKSTVEKLGEQVNKIIKISGGTAAREYAKNFLDVIEKASPETQKALANYLSTVDWTSMTDALDAMEYMQELNIDTDSIQSFWNIAVDGANAYVASLTEALQLQDRLNKKLSSINEIEERLSSGKGTSDDMQRLVEIGVDISQFRLGTEGWGADEGIVKGAIRLLREDNLDQTRSAIRANQDTYNELKSGYMENLEGVDLASALQAYNFLELAEGETLENVDKQKVEAAMAEYHKFMDQFDQIKFIMQSQLEYGESTLYETDEALARALMKTSSGETANRAVEKELQGRNIELSDFDAYIKKIQESNDELSKTSAQLIAIKNIRFNDGLKKIIDSYKDWTQLIDKNTGLIKAETQDEITIFNKLKKAVNEAFGVDLGDEFYTKENIELIKKAAEGDTIAIDQLIAKVDEINKLELLNLILSIDSEKLNEEMQGAYNIVVDFIQNHEIPKMEAGVEVPESDFKNFLTQLYELLNAVGFTETEINKELGKIGYHVEVTYKTIKHPRLSRLNPLTDLMLDEGGPVVTYEDIQIPQLQFISNGDYTPSDFNINNAQNNAPKSSGGGGSSSKPTYWKNPYDELFNLQEKINEALRRREALERRYQQLLKSASTSIEEIRKGYFDQITALREQIKLQEQLAAGRLRQINALGNQYYTDENGQRRTYNSYGVQKYARYDASTGLLQIDWAALEAIANDASQSEKGKAIEEYINKLQELVDSYEDVRDAIWDIEDQIEDLTQQAIDSYISFEDRVMEAVVAQYEKEIESLEKMNDTITDSMNKVINSIQEQIREQRQERDNAKTEKDIAEKEARLAYLRRDTSGANDMEIMQLEKELEDARQNYEDKLIDQAIEQMQKDADLAAEQRAQQIEVMRAQLDMAKETGALWNEVYDLINNAFDGDGQVNMNSELVKLLQSTEAFIAMSAFGQDEWIKNFVQEFWTAWEGLTAGGATSSGQHEGGGSSAPGGSGGTEGSTPGTGGTTTEPGANAGSPYMKASDTTGVIKRGDTGDQVRAIQYALNMLGFGNSGTKSIDGKFGPGTETAVKNFQTKVDITADGKVGDKTREQFRLRHYKTGGLVDFTGPAWLDGSKSRPELVLNPRDSQNFIILKDVLSSIINGWGKDIVNTPGHPTGDNYFDIDINADIGSDYDVDRLAARIKEQIVLDGTYRNVNVLNYMR